MSDRSALSVMRRRERPCLNARRDALKPKVRGAFGTQNVEPFGSLRAHYKARSVNGGLGKYGGTTPRAKARSWSQRREAKPQSPDGVVKRGAGGKRPRHGNTKDNHNLSCQTGCVFEIVSWVRAERPCALRRSKPLRGSTRCSTGYNLRF